MGVSWLGSLEYVPDDVLYAWEGSNLYSIDVDNLEAAFIRSFSQGYSGGAGGGGSVTIVPEPATLLLLSLGAMMLRRKR